MSYPNPKLEGCKFALCAEIDGMAVVSPGRYDDRETAERVAKALGDKFGARFIIVIIGE